jgi:hypothetical protein
MSVSERCVRSHVTCHHFKLYRNKRNGGGNVCGRVKLPLWKGVVHYLLAKAGVYTWTIYTQASIDQLVGNSATD